MVPDRRLTGLLVLLVIPLLGCPVWGQGPEEEKKPAIKQPTLSELAKLYHDLELPLPPRDAKFAKITLEQFINNRPEKHHQIYWCLKIGSKVRLWNGLSEVFLEATFPGEPLEKIYEKPPKPDEILTILKLERLTAPPDDYFENRPELVFAIQCHLLGHHEQARFFYWRCLKAATEPLDHTLIIAAWNHWVEQLTDPVRDRRPVFTKLEGLFKKYAILSSREKGSLNQWKDHDRILEQVKLTLEPSKAKPGSVEALIDALVDSRTKEDNSPARSGEIDLWNREEQIRYRKEVLGFDPHSDAEIRLAKLGFKAISALIEHVDDQRLTRDPIRRNHGLAGVPRRTYSHLDFTTVGSKVRTILQTYFPYGLSSLNGVFEVKKSDYINYWIQIRKKEELFYIDQITNEENEKIYIFQSLRRKFPDKIKDFYLQIIQKRLEKQNLYNFTYHILDSEITKKEKIELLILAARSSYFPFQKAGLDGLLELDPAICSNIAWDLLANLPKGEIAKDQDDPNPRLELARLLFCSQLPQDKERLILFVKQLPLKTKIEFIKDPFANVIYRPDKYYAIDFFNYFLDDNNIYDENNTSGKFYFFSNRFLVSEMEGGSLAAMKILEFLDIEIPVDNNTPPHQWERIREFAKNEVERRREEEKRK